MTEKQILPNHNPNLYVATPIQNEDQTKITDVSLYPIIAWKLENPKRPDPVTLESYCDRHVIIDTQTGHWTERANYSGKGLDALIEFFDHEFIREAKVHPENIELQTVRKAIEIFNRPDDHDKTAPF